MADNSMPMEQEPHCSSSNVPNVSDILANIHVLYTNISALNSNIDHLIYEVSFSQPDLIILTETHLSRDHSDSDFVIPGYQLKRADRSTDSASKGGGVAIYVAEQINNYAMCDLNIQCIPGGPSRYDALWLNITVGTTFLSVAGIYRPPNSDRSVDDELMMFLEERLNDFNDGTIGKNAKLIIAGDFNLSIDWGSPIESRTKNINDCYREFFRDQELVQCMPEPNRKGFTSPLKWLDLIFHKNFISEPQVTTGAPLGNSDHMIAYVQFGYPSKKRTWSSMEVNKSWWSWIEDKPYQDLWSNVDYIISSSARSDGAFNGWSPWMNTSEVQDMRKKKEEAWDNYKRSAKEYENACQKLKEARDRAMDLLREGKYRDKLIGYIKRELRSSAPFPEEDSDFPSVDFIRLSLTKVDPDNAIQTIGVPAHVLQQNAELLAPFIQKIITKMVFDSWLND